MIKLSLYQPYTIEREIFVGLNFCYRALKAYFRGLIFVVRSEHVIIVALSRFSCIKSFWGALRNENNENKTQQKFLAIRYTVSAECDQLRVYEEVFLFICYYVRDIA